MSNREPVPLHAWLAEPLAPEVAAAVERLRRAPDVQRIVLMPDVHLAADICIGTVVASTHLLYPQAVGGDIGCGMLAVAFDCSAERLADPATAGRVLAAFGRSIPTLRRHRRAMVPTPADVACLALSHPALEAHRRSEAALQLGTLGSGNHFVELQADEDEQLWLMIHSGSRSLGQAIRDHHLALGHPVGSGLRALDAKGDAGQAYIRDVHVARRYADANRRAMASAAADALADLLSATPKWETLIAIDHNHIAHEEHDGCALWVHRKGAMPAFAGQAGVLPGSMGTASYHVEGRGCAAALCSSAHGAGRALSRHTARAALSARDLHRQMAGIWYDYRYAAQLREEAPAAYKDIRAVLRAEHELVKVTRVLRPVLNYKGR